MSQHSDIAKVQLENDWAAGSAHPLRLQWINLRVLSYELRKAAQNDEDIATDTVRAKMGHSTPSYLDSGRPS